MELTEEGVTENQYAAYTQEQVTEMLAEMDQYFARREANIEVHSRLQFTVRSRARTPIQNDP